MKPLNSFADMQGFGFLFIIAFDKLHDQGVTLFELFDVCKNLESDLQTFIEFFGLIFNFCLRKVFFFTHRWQASFHVIHQIDRFGAS